MNVLEHVEQVIAETEGPLSSFMRRHLFELLWLNNAPWCKTCGATEGMCDEATCERLRLTHRHELQRGW